MGLILGLKTQPKKSWPLLIEVVNYAQELDLKEVENMLLAIFIELIKIRNKDDHDWFPTGF